MAVKLPNSASDKGQPLNVPSKTHRRIVMYTELINTE